MIDKKHAKEQLEKLIRKYEKNRAEIINRNSKYTEADARREYIDCFLEVFGWDVSNKAGKSLSESDVVTESMIDNKNKPDYLLRRNGMIFYTLEAEKPSKNIHKDNQPATQVLRYGWNANNKVGLLFNVETFQIFQTCEKPDTTIVRKPWKSFEYTEFMNNFDLLWDLLSIESVYKGTAENVIDSITPQTATKTSLDQYFLNELDEWRVLIGNDLVNSKERDEYVDSEKNFKKLNDDTQTFLNQIIFLRFAEDNQLEQYEPNTLEYVFEDSASFSKKLKQLDQRYNSGIFKNSNIASLLSLDTISTICKSLYYPLSSYNFAIIDLGILGRIYEQFLQRELIYDEDSRSVSLVKTTQASIKSVVSTPIELTHLITEKALSEKLANIHSIDQLMKLRVADISVGSGVFLVNVYDRLISKAVDLLDLRKGSENVEAPLNIKKQLLAQTLYGADIDYHASQVTKFSLALRLLRGESSQRFRNQTPIIPSLEQTIVCQNSLISTKDVSNFLNMNPDQIDNITDDEIDAINPNNGELEKFDVILGNPPYLNTKEMIETSKLEFKLYKNKFTTAYKQFDKYFLFIEQMLNQLKSDGVGTFITSNKFASIGAGTKLRKMLSQHVVSFIDFGATQLFPQKDIYVAIVMFSSQKTTKFKYATAKSISDAKTPKFIDLNVSEMSDDDYNWFLTTNKKALKLYRKTMNFPRIADEFSIHVGVQTSNNLVYLIKNKEILEENDKYIKFKKNKKMWTVEKSITRPFFKNLDHKGTYYTQPISDSILIFPYDDDGRLKPLEELRDKFPLCWRYLNYYKNKLLPKNLGGKRDVQPNPSSDQWYMYGRSQGLTGWNEDKLIIGVMSNKPSTAYDANHMVLASGGTAGYIPVFQGESQYALEYVEAWINYPVVDEIFRMLSTDFRGEYWTHGKDKLAQVPFLTIDQNDSQQLSLYKRIVEYTKKINHSLSKKKIEILVSSVNNMLDKMVRLRIGDNY